MKSPEAFAESSNDEVQFRRLFAAGNYTDVALNGPPDNWRTHAAKGLLGKTRESVEGLAGFDCPEARFYQGVAHWIGCEESEALRCLEEVPTANANALIRLIRKPRIKVLAQLVSTANHNSFFLDAVSRDDKFDVSNIGFSESDLFNRANTDVAAFFNPLDPPDFYFAHVLEWHYLPYNLSQLPCPKFAHTCDYDVSLTMIRSWFPMFDGLLVSCGSEWTDVAAISGRPTYTFAKCFGVKENLPQILGPVRQHDIFLSGSLFDPIFHEKAILLKHLLSLPEIKLKIVNGFLSEEEYVQNVRQSKLALTFYRRSGGTVTRGLEALSLGCATLVQGNSVLSMFANEQHGLFTYEFSREGIRASVSRVLDNWPQVSQGLNEGARIIRREFSRPVVISQYLRFLTFLAACRPQPKADGGPLEVQQKRLFFIKGGLPLHADMIEALKRAQRERADSKPVEQKELADYLDLAREHVLEYGSYVALFGQRGDEKYRHLLDDALKLYRQAMAVFPKHLVPRFNFVRCSLHYGSGDQVAEGLTFARGVISQGIEHWSLSTDDDIFTWDFHNTMLNFRGYVDRLVKNLREDLKDTLELKKVLLASLHYYLSFYEYTVDHLEQAVKLDPDFPFYSFRLALMLLCGEQQGQDLRRAEEILTRHLHETMLWAEAYAVLNDLTSSRIHRVAEEDSDLVEGLERIDGYDQLQCMFESSELIKRVKCIDPKKNLVNYLKTLGPSTVIQQTLPGQRNTDGARTWQRYRDWLRTCPFWVGYPRLLQAARRVNRKLFLSALRR